MHGFLWVLHADHHKKDHDSWFERNDAFFIFYAVVSIGCFLLWQKGIFELGLAVGLGIFAYGVAYFIVHDIFIHQRFKLFRNANNLYAKGVRRAHKMHHKHIGKEDGESFGMLFIHPKYFDLFLLGFLDNLHDDKCNLFYCYYYCCCCPYY